MQAKIGEKKKKKERERRNQDKHVCEPASTIIMTPIQRGS